ncbi:MAG: exo-alpha-sialidase [Theionarchaea archaeon]|nr:exo-alpha-sialidase [Theionarchaea archaeon]
MKLKSRSVFYRTPGPGIWVTGTSVYTRAQGFEKMRMIGTVTRSDTTDAASRSYSDDNGKSWSDPETINFITTDEGGVHRTYALPGFVDPVRDRFLSMILDGTLPTDDPMEGMKRWHLRYSVSRDGGRTNTVEEQVIQSGYAADHPCEGVWIGKNSMMIGDTTCRPIRTRGGEILVPVQVTPVGPEGEYHNPGGGYTYHDSAVLIGRWTSGDRIEWDLSEYVSNDPALSTRGALEPTIAEMPDGRILMVMRGSNDANPDWPGIKWYSTSEDGGRTWGNIEPWTYADGTKFYSPSSCSQLLEHSNGSYYWLGNVTPRNPVGNRPRYPLVIGEVNPESCLLDRNSVMVIENRERGQPIEMSLSNFLAHEDRENGDILLNMSPLFAREFLDWTGDAFLYRILP